MKISPPVSALLAALLVSGCASSPWQSTERVSGGTLYVPKLYAPLRPGSIYPDRKTPVPAKGRPAIVVVCPETGDCRKDAILDRAAQRGLVVLLGKEPKDDLLRTRAEADPERIGWLLVRPDQDFLGKWIRAGAQGAATAVIGPPSFPSYPSKHLLFAALASAEPLEAGDGRVLKLYSADEKGHLPAEAFRDAVEWLASELGPR